MSARDGSALVHGVLLLALCAATAACQKGPDEAAFMQACLTGPRQVGTRANCECAAKEARTLSSEQQQMMVLDMAGRAQEAAAITSKLSPAEQAHWIEQQFAIVSKCYADR